MSRIVRTNVCHRMQTAQRGSKKARTVWQSSGRSGAAIAEEPFSPSPASPPAAPAPSSVEDAASEPPAPVALAQKDALISGTELRRPLRSGDLASAPAIATRAGAITARGLLAATRVGNLAAAAARSIEAGEVEEAET
jgi:hypothetical protein